VDIDGSDLRWSWFQPWLPKGIDVQGGWGFTLAGEWRPGQPAFELGLSSAGAQLHWQQLPALQIAVTSLALDASLDASQLRVKGQGTTQAHGDFSGSATFDKTSIDADLAIANAQLASLLPLISSQVSSEGQATGISRLSGYLDTRLHLSGKRTQPYLQGTAVVRDGSLALSAMPLPLEAVNMTIEFDRHKAKGQGNFRVSGVPGDVRGQLALAPDGWHGELALVAEQIPLQLDDNVELTIAPDIALTLTPELVHLHGQVGIPHARVKLRQLPPQAVKPSADAVIVRSRAKDGLASGDRQRLRVTSDVKLLLGDDVIFQGFGLDTHLRGQLTLSQGSEQVTRANGRISLHQGRYRAYGQSLQIRHGDLIFIGDLDNPQLRIEAVRPLTDNQLVVGLRAEGPARNPSIRLFSIPEMPQQAKLHYLLTGQPPGVVSQQNSNHIATQALLSLGLDASGGLLDNTAKTLGVDQFRISAESGYAGPEVSLSGYLGSNLMVRYGIGVFDGVNALALRYHLARNLYLEAISGTANSLDLLWSIERAR
jgi:translocation and assembly module TamB